MELSKLRKDLIMAMDDPNSAKEKAKVLSNDLKAKRQLTLEKDKSGYKGKGEDGHCQVYRGLPID